MARGWTIVREPTEKQLHNCYRVLPVSGSQEFEDLATRTVVECFCGRQYIKIEKAGKDFGPQWRRKWLSARSLHDGSPNA